MTKYLSRNIACSRCEGPCTPEYLSATLRDEDGKVLEYLCPSCADKVEQELMNIDAQSFKTESLDS